jgi:hypothetical protein
MDANGGDSQGSGSSFVVRGRKTLPVSGNSFRSRFANVPIMSAKYMPLYVAEFQFRYNNRENGDIFGTTISGC